LKRVSADKTDREIRIRAVISLDGPVGLAV
jgi:hypothetical protein